MKLSEMLDSRTIVRGDISNINITGITADSRQLKKGNLFAALVGVENDGRRFIPDVLMRGAAAILMGPDGAGDVPPDVPIIIDDNPRKLLAGLASKFYHSQPDICVGITGTNGKTSVASFLRQIWENNQINAASIGTIGVVNGKNKFPLHHTTPDAVEIQQLLASLKAKDVTHLALEASSHGLAQHRCDGVKFSAAAFTNLSRDHLDYHDSVEDYLNQKMRLFSELLQPGQPAVINVDNEFGKKVEKEARKRGLKIISVGKTGADFRLVRTERASYGQKLTVSHSGERTQVVLPLVGDFQAENAIVAAALACACGMDEKTALESLAGLTGAKGRLELIGRSNSGAAAFVDYAHTPDALATVLKTLRPFTDNRLIVIFGAGGDRDPGKRVMMGKAAAEFADISIVTDDNPRSESASKIRAAILKGVPDAVEIGDRATAITAGVRMLREGDVLLVAGKGHEEGQLVGDKLIPFSDHNVLQDALRLEVKRA